MRAFGCEIIVYQIYFYYFYAEEQFFSKHQAQNIVTTRASCKMSQTLQGIVHIHIRVERKFFLLFA